MTLPVKRILVFLLILIVLSTVGFKIYRTEKTKHVVAETFLSPRYIARYKGFLNDPRTTGGIVFFGNSLTEQFDLTVFGDTSIVNRGISGDFTEGLLKRVDEVISLQPAKLFIEIGVNDIFAKVPPSEIMWNYNQLIKKIKKECPGTKIYIQSNLPVLRDGTLTSNAGINATIKEQNEQLQKLANTYDLMYIDLHDRFEKDGALNPSLSVDGVHLNEAGYVIWKEALLPYLKK